MEVEESLRRINFPIVACDRVVKLSQLQVSIPCRLRNANLPRACEIIVLTALVNILAYIFGWAVRYYITSTNCRTIWSSAALPPDGDCFCARPTRHP